MLLLILIIPTVIYLSKDVDYFELHCRPLKPLLPKLEKKYSTFGKNGINPEKGIKMLLSETHL
jgi:hypothetical protein